MLHCNMTAAGPLGPNGSEARGPRNPDPPARGAVYADPRKTRFSPDSEQHKIVLTPQFDN